MTKSKDGVSVVSGEHGFVELTPSMREKLVVFSDGSAFVNENCTHDAVARYVIRMVGCIHYSL